MAFSLTGPLNAKLPDYMIQSQLSNLRLEREHFTSGALHIESKKGKINIRQIELLKKNGQLRLTGAIHPGGNMNLDILGGGLYLQDSPNMMKYLGTKWLGTVDGGMHIQGTFARPLITTHLEVKNTYFKGQTMEDSKLSLQLSPNNWWQRGYYLKLYLFIIWYGLIIRGK